MSKIRTYHETDGHRIVVTKHRFRDLLDLDRFPAPFRKYKQLFGMSREDFAQDLATRLVRAMLKELATLLVDHACCFVLPGKHVGYIHVKDIGNPLSSMYASSRKSLDPLPENHIFRVVLDPQMVKWLQDTKPPFRKRWYDLKPTVVLKERLAIQVMAGKKFAH